ncbi:amino acid adenylation domain-containing protein [Luteimonas sp. XNQY3]|nr:non-ribosomal peptide synthetase/type I polyketide synthase [Luteimonas sp. XNQY3]MCD9006283.1 amino acid adenylation domain-containing protein [Luteimonas sp. XNQY3]
MNTAGKLLELLRSRDIIVSVEGGRLRTRAPTGAMTEEIAAQIRDHRDALVALLESGQDADAPRERAAREAVRSGDVLPMTGAQRRLWLTQKISSGGGLYNVPLAVRLKGTLDIEALLRALQGLVSRHHALRTRFVEADGDVVAILDDGLLAPTLHRMEASQLNPDTLERTLHALAWRPFDMEHDLPIRADLFLIDDQEAVLLLCMNHIITDGWSCAVLVDELETLYNAGGDQTLLPAVPVQFHEHARWCAGAEAQQQQRDDLAYWTRQLAGAPAAHALPLDHPRPRVQSYEGASSRHTLDAPLVTALRGFALERGVTVYTVMQAAFALTFSRWSNEKDILIGTSSSGRDHPMRERIVGFLVNPLILRTRIDDDLTVAGYLANAQSMILDAFEHQHAAFEDVVREVVAVRSPAHAPVFQLMFNYQVAGRTRLSLDGLTCERLRLAGAGAKYDIEVTATDFGGHLELDWVHATGLFRGESIRRLQASFLVVLEAVIASADARIGTLPHLPAEERAAIEAAGTGPVRARTGVPVWERVAAHALTTPDAVAVEHGGRTFSYACIDALATTLARRLRGQGVRGGECVGIHVEPGPALVAAILGIWRAGAAYVPIDPGYPTARVAHILQDAGVRVVVAGAPGSDVMPPAGHAVIHLDVDAPEHCDAHGLDAGAPVPPVGCGVAYVLYTSGTTGRPKGVLIPHDALANYLDHAVGYFRQETRGAVVSTSISFDATLTSLLVPLLLGKRVLILERALDAMFDGLRRHLMEDAHAWLFKLTPSHLSALAPDLRAMGPVGKAHVLVIGGEQLDHSVLAQWRSRWLPDATYINEYGPTETVVGCCTYRVDVHTQLAATTGAVPIGTPIRNTQMLIVSDGRLAPMGMVGELYIGGAGVADGYVGLPELTASCFVTLAEAGASQRFYRTGDMMLLRHDGLFEFVNRHDEQIKIRGYRVETGEIETALRTVDGVSNAAVLTHPGDAGAVLVAYLQPAGHVQDLPAFVQEVKRCLAGIVPDYMVPTLFKLVPVLPLTVNGKIDRTALSALDVAALSGAGAAPPSTGTEAALCTMWQQAVAVEDVGIHDNFFEIGGTSMLFLRMRGEIEERFGCRLDIVAFFEHPTIAALAAYIEQSLGTAAPGSVDLPATPVASASDPQARIAVISVAGRFPDAPTPEALWKNLCAGHEALQVCTDEELLAQGYEAALLTDPGFVRSGAVPAGLDLFDADFFRMTPREAQLLDPQQRLLLECSVEALESAGYGDAGTPRRCGVFVGCGESAYLAGQLLGNVALLKDMGLQVLHANSPHYLATRIAYKLDLTGPAINVATACSTSLVAVHQAVTSLRRGECAMALAGGAGVSRFAPGGYLYSEGAIESRDGRCHAFDARASGTRAGNGAGLVLLKRLEDAERDGDPVLAVITGSAINNDGANKVGYTAPSVAGQVAVIESALRDAGVRAEDVQYVETHGTGTPLGDPIEAQALGRVYQGCAEATCTVGTLKPNIGHLDAAAGVAGLIKAVMGIRDGILAPAINFDEPNPQIPFSGSPFRVNTQLAAWPPASGPRRAGVSAFGIGGTNAHVILEQAPPAPAATHVADDPDVHVLTVSARSAAALDMACARLAHHLDASATLSLADVAWTLQVGRTAHAFRRTVACGNCKEAALLLSGRPAHASMTAQQSVPVVWMFPGQGTQRLAMARALYLHEPVFRATLDTCSESLQNALGCDLRALLYPSADDRQAERLLAQTQFAQPALFAVEYSLARVLLHYGVRPSALIGHSLGEYVAACVAGVFSVEEGLAMVAARGRLMQQMEPGAMLAVRESATRLGPWLEASGLELAAINADDACVVAGESGLILQLQAHLADEGVATSLLETGHAFHSRMMEPMLGAWRSVVSRVQLHAPKIPVMSNVSGERLSDAQATDPEYWVQHLRATVRFSEGLRAAIDGSVQQGERCALLEVGPGHVLSRLSSRLTRGSAHYAVSVLGDSSDDLGAWRAFKAALGRLWELGVRIDWMAGHASGSRRRVALPTYPFERQRYWLDAQGAAEPTPSVSPLGSHEEWFHAPVWRPSGAGPGGTKPEAAQGTWLLVADAGGTASALAEALRAAGRDAVILHPPVRPSASPDDDQASSNGLLAGCAETVAALRRDNKHIEGAVHLRALDMGTQGAGDDVQAYDAVAVAMQGAHQSLVELIRALPVDAREQPLPVHVVTRDAFLVTGRERVSPEQATMIGLCRVAPQEYPHLDCRHVDLDLDLDSDIDLGTGLEPLDEAGSPLPSMALLVQELLAGGQDRTVAFRGGVRWVQSHVPVHRAQAGLTARLRRGGVYLITGGLGNVGYAIAAHLAGMAARIVLVIRDTVPERSKWGNLVVERSKSDPMVVKLERLLALESKGAQVLVCSADVADEAAMHAAFEAAEVRFGRIDGVIHCAGDVRNALMPIAELTQSGVRAQFLAKAKGTMVLHRVLRHRQVDFCVLMSSLSTVLGGLGFAAYAAANAFMDAFAAARHARGDTRWLSINWDGWNVGGKPSSMTEARMTDSRMTGEQGAAALAYVLSWSDAPQLVHCTGDLRRRRDAWVDRSASREATSHLHVRGVNPMPVAASTTIETELVAIWQQLLGMHDVGVRDGFFDIGGDSLLATMMVARINKEFSISLPIRTVFEEETIERIAATIDEMTKRPPQGRPLALKRSGSRPPLFCIHPGSGFARPYMALLRYLPQERPVYALEARGLNDDDVLPSTIAQMCSDYIEQMQRIQPEGPYLLLGWSFGAIVAHAMAAELQQRGIGVAGLVMIDPTPLGDDPWPEQAITDHRRDLEERLVGYRDYQDASDELKQMMIDRMSAIQENNTRLSYYRDPKTFHGDTMIVIAKDSDHPGKYDAMRAFIPSHVEEVRVPYHHNILLTSEALESYAGPLCGFIERQPISTVIHSAPEVVE